MNKETCSPSCLFLKDNCEELDLHCYYQQDKPVTPFNLTLKHRRYEEVVTVIAENDMIIPTWVLSNGSRISKNNPWEK